MDERSAGEPSPGARRKVRIAGIVTAILVLAAGYFLYLVRHDFIAFMIALGAIVVGETIVLWRIVRVPDAERRKDDE